MLGPTKPVFCLQQRPGERKTWLRAGTATTNKNGSITVRLDVLPLSGVLLIGDSEPDPDPRGK